MSLLCDPDQLQERCFVCEARIVFLPGHHFVPLWTEFPLPFYCSMTESCKIFLQFFAAHPSLCVGDQSDLQALSARCSSLFPCHVILFFPSTVRWLEEQEIQHWDRGGFSSLKTLAHEWIEGSVLLSGGTTLLMSNAALGVAVCKMAPSGDFL